MFHDNLDNNNACPTDYRKEPAPQFGIWDFEVLPKLLHLHSSFSFTQRKPKCAMKAAQCGNL